jgi:membrane protein
MAEQADAQPDAQAEARQQDTKRHRTPSGPTELSGRSWLATGKRTLKEFTRDNLTDRAAALTYYSVLSLFPGLIVITSLLGFLDAGATKTLIDNVGSIIPGTAHTILVNATQQLQQSHTLAGPLAVVGLLGALWSASGYLGAFMRASNAIYDIEEGRPVWKTLPLRVGLTLAVVVVLAVCAVGVVVTGSLAQKVGQMLGIGSTGVLVWDIVKWPVILVLVSLVFAVLFWAAPNVRQPRFRWLSPGGLVAVLVWLVASVGFGFYVAHFSSYNKTYGSLGGVIIFLVWLWISNIAVLFGAELNAELARAERMETGHPADQEPFLPPRDTRAMDAEGRSEAEAVSGQP